MFTSSLEEKLNILRAINTENIENVLAKNIDHLIAGHDNVSDEDITKNFVSPIYVNERFDYKFQKENGSFRFENGFNREEIKKELCTYLKAYNEEIEENLRDSHETMKGYTIKGNSSFKGISVAFDSENGALRYTTTEGFGLIIEKEPESISGIQAKSYFNSKPKNEQSYYIKLEDYFTVNPDIDSITQYAFIREHTNKNEQLNIKLRRKPNGEKILNMKNNDIGDGYIYSVNLYENGKIEGTLKNPLKKTEISSTDTQTWNEFLNKLPAAKREWNKIKEEYGAIKNNQIIRLFPNRNNEYMENQSRIYTLKHEKPAVKILSPLAKDKFECLNLPKREGRPVTKKIVFTQDSEQSRSVFSIKM